MGRIILTRGELDQSIFQYIVQIGIHAGINDDNLLRQMVLLSLAADVVADGGAALALRAGAGDETLHPAHLLARRQAVPTGPAAPPGVGRYLQVRVKVVFHVCKAKSFSKWGLK